MVLLLCPPAVSRLLNVKADSPRCCNRKRQLVVAVSTTCTVVQSVDASIDPCTCMCLHTVYIYVLYSIHYTCMYNIYVLYSVHYTCMYNIYVLYSIHYTCMYYIYVLYSIHYTCMYYIYVLYSIHYTCMYYIYMYYTVYSSFWEGYAGCDVRTYTRCHLYLLSSL